MSTQTADLVATQWNHLPELDQASRLTDADRRCLDDVRDVLVKHGCLDRFGVNLLHKHFEVADDEILVEQVDWEGRRLVTKPVKVEVVRAAMRSAYETQWHWRPTLTREVALVCIVRCFQGSYEAPGHAVKHVGW